MGASTPAWGWTYVFLKTSKLALGPTQPTVQCVPGVKRSGREADHSTPFNAPRLRMSRATLLFPPCQYAFIAWTGATLSFCIVYTSIFWVYVKCFLVLWGVTGRLWQCLSVPGTTWRRVVVFVTVRVLWMNSYLLPFTVLYPAFDGFVLCCDLRTSCH
jgi:hypothetical protein